ncbi:restriction endonuclease subunit S [Acidithiobacillus caldus]|nr:restriction endonuclease subunit S [Acidithiobacillus caldus]
MRLMRRSFSVIQNVFPLIGRTGVCDTNFLYYGTKGRVHPEEYKGHFPDYRRKWIPIPPLPEQRRIAHILGTLDDKIENNRKTAKTLEAMAQAIFKSWFVDFDPVRAKMAGESRESICKRLKLTPEILDLFPDRLVDSELGEIPEGWTVGTFEDYADIVGGSTPSTGNPDYWTGGTYYWATPKDLSNLKVPVLLTTESKITEAGLEQISSRLLPIGTVLLSSRAPIGYLAITEIPVAINQGFIALKPHNHQDSIFVMLLIKHNMEEIISRANGSTFLEVSKAKFRPIPVLHLDKIVRGEFAKTVFPLYRLIISMEKSVIFLSQLRDTLLPKLISGNLLIRGLHDTQKADALEHDQETAKASQRESRTIIRGAE